MRRRRHSAESDGDRGQKGGYEDCWKQKRDPAREFLPLHTRFAGRAFVFFRTLPVAVFRRLDGNGWEHS
jgi:hypothetical protein